MGDRTSLQAYVYDCPEEQRPAAVRVLMEDHGLDMEFADQEGDPLNLDTPYFAAEAPLGTSGEVAAALRAQAPGASFYLWEDPSDSSDGPLLGTLHAYAPELGEFTADCDQHGNPVFTRAQVNAMLGQAIEAYSDGSPAEEQMADAVDQWAGGPWITDKTRSLDPGCINDPPQPGDPDHEPYDPAKNREALAELARAREAEGNEQR